MPFFDDRGFYKRAQIVPSDLALAGVADFWDLDALTIFADNLVPHVLRVDGVLTYDPDLGARIDREELLPPGDEEREIRACALHACETIAAGLQVPPRILDIWLWNRGQEPRYKALPPTSFGTVADLTKGSDPDGAFRAPRNSPSVANGLAPLLAAEHADWMIVPTVIPGSPGPASFPAPARSDGLK